jgi:hypothetical protein
VLKSALNKQEANYADEITRLNADQEELREFYDSEIKRFRDGLKQSSEDYERAITAYQAQVKVMRENYLVEMTKKKGVKKG